jgi:hypothetical protein
MTSVARSVTRSLGAAAVALVVACSAEAPPRARPPSPSPSSTTTPVAPTLYFNLNDEEEALDYLSDIEGRADEALHRGDLGALHDIYTADGPAREPAARRIVRNFERGLVDRTRHRAVRTEVLAVRSQVAVFRQVRLVLPCVFSYDTNEDVTPDPRVIRQVVVVRMVAENLNWKLDRVEVVRGEPTGRTVTACPP